MGFQDQNCIRSGKKGEIPYLPDLDRTAENFVVDFSDTLFSSFLHSNLIKPRDHH